MRTKEASFAIGLVLLLGPLGFGAEPARWRVRKPVPQVIPLEYLGVSLPLSEIAPIRVSSGPKRIIPLRTIPWPPSPLSRPDPVLQQSPGHELSITPGLNFDGIGDGVYGYTVTGAPPDTNGAVGDTQYVQWVNTSYAVFNKSTGALVAGPTAGNTIWSSLGPSDRCATDNDGDPIVLYDKLAGRWMMTQFVASSPYLQCIAVSTSSDATGTYYLYELTLSALGDYPKIGVWPDAYYFTFAMFTGGVTYAGPKVCALDRAAMLLGNTASAVCFQKASTVGLMLPSDVDGTTSPPGGATNYVLRLSVNSVQLYKFHVDFLTPANSTFTGPTSLPTAAFVGTCDNGYYNCVLQSQTKVRLDSLGDRLMHRLAYRNFPSANPAHESLVVTHSIKVGNSGSAVRWYEIRDPGGTPAIFQQGTYSPNPGTWRWMGSIAMDKVGNIAVGYSASSRTMHPAIRFAGRVPGDTAGTLSAETSIIEGTGSQGLYLGSPMGRWGDYSAMTVDPVDDCTFWYTNEYLTANGVFNWHTRIASFKFSTCN